MINERTIRWPDDYVEADRLIIGFCVKALEAQGREFGPELRGALAAAKAYLAGEIELQDRFKLAPALWAADDLDSDLNKPEPLERRLAIVLVNKYPSRGSEWEDKFRWFFELMEIGDYDFSQTESIFEEHFSAHRK